MNPWRALLLPLLLASTASASCYQSDVKALCCSAACAAYNSTKWYRANDVLRGCMRGLGCESSSGATVGTKCECRVAK